MSAADRAVRLLSIIPWIAAQPDGATFDEIADRFGYDVKRLRTDLMHSAPFVGPEGADPYDLMQIEHDDERIRIFSANDFTRPLRLTPSQAVALISAVAGLAGAFGTSASPLQSGLAKLATLLEFTPGDTIDIHLGSADPLHLELLTTAIEQHQVVQIDYYSLGRDDRSVRAIEPLSLQSRDGAWYLSAWCRSAQGIRRFRIDRIHRLDPTDQSFAPRQQPAAGLLVDADHVPRVTLRVASHHRWIADYYPVDSIEEAADGDAVVVLPVTEGPWLERLLLQLGSGVEVIAADPPYSVTMGVDAARVLLARYDQPSSGGKSA